MIDRRTLLAGTAGVAAIGLPGLARAATPKGAPVARLSPTVDDYPGSKLTDNYRWMENPKDPDWLPFLKGQNAATRASLDAIPGRAALAQRITALSGDAAFTMRVRIAGALTFYQQRPAGADNYKLFVRDGSGATRVLIDPTTMGQGDRHMSLDWWEPSFDGRHIVYGLSESGSEASILHIMVVASGEVLPDRIPNTDYGVTGWLPDGSGFFYIAFTGARGTPQFYLNSEARLHRLGSDPARDTTVLKKGQYPAIALSEGQVPFVLTIEGSDRVIAAVSDIRPERALYSASLAAVLAGTPEWRRIADFDDLVVSLAVNGDRLFLLSNRDAARGRVLETSLASPALATARVALPEGPVVLEELNAARDGVYVTQMDGGIQRLGRLGPKGLTPVKLPFDGSIGWVVTSQARDGALVMAVGWLDPSGVWQVAGDGRVSDTGINPRPPIDTSGYETRRGFATAKDGVKIPYTIIAKKGLAATGRNPVLATGYGAYQLSSTPRFSPAIFAFLDAGGVYVNANVRGGGEYGRAWHKGGQKATKPNTWRDLIAVCEQLIADRITAPAHLAISGTSAGGITVGRAMTERPDLFAAVINNVGWSNPVRYMAEQNVADIDEWGPIVDADSFRIMLAMDSYQAVRDGTHYPAMLNITGATDPRVAPWHVTKMAARVQAATASSNPVLLRIDFDAGHGVGSTRSQSDALAADMYSFVLWQTGAKGFQPG
ncbi:MAG: protease II [Verrucomicrobiales bacterium VVV1]|nr:MAG: protease II [Verrucomicrobiales bacterium VVV1]